MLDVLTPRLFGNRASAILDPRSRVRRAIPEPYQNGFGGTSPSPLRDGFSYSLYTRSTNYLGGWPACMHRTFKGLTSAVVILRHTSSFSRTEPEERANDSSRKTTVASGWPQPSPRNLTRMTAQPLRSISP